MKRKIVNQFVNLDFFELPKKSLFDKFNNFIIQLTANKIEPDCSTILLCNKTSLEDKNYLSPNISSDFVYLKDDITFNLLNGIISSEEETSLFDSIKLLKEANISVVIFESTKYSAFGENPTLSIGFTNFLRKLEMPICFISLIGTFFTHPVWSNSKSTCFAKIEIRANIKPNELSYFEEYGYNKKLNSFIPSSASTYQNKYKLFSKSNRRAEGIERVLYSCPNCNQFFTLYSHFNCVRCKNCLTAFEITNQFEISLLDHINNLDKLYSNQLSTLNACIFSDKALKTYYGIENTLTKKTGSLSIFKNKIVYESIGSKKTINFGQILDVSYDYNNKIKIVLKSENQLIYRGKNNEPLYLIYDLFYNLKQKDQG